MPRFTVPRLPGAMGFPGSPRTLLRAAETACTYVLAGSHPKCRHREFAALHELAGCEL